MADDKQAVAAKPLSGRTLDQIRAEMAWGYVGEGLSKSPKYKNVAKSAPSLIMNSGLMATLAFYRSKSEGQQLVQHLIDGLVTRLSPPDGSLKRSFLPVMKHLQSCNGQEYMRWTHEALELLKWMRQFVDALSQANKEEDS